uniref:AC5 protein n=1 Tax=Tomato leaf curl Joydebpur virus TaxID=309390 RepID=A0A1Y0DIW8_9GEMI|nr:AC5 protein [Tomato leaf curl Joydebpur virus]
MTLPMCWTSCLDSKDGTLHGPSNPLGPSGLLDILEILGLLVRGLFAHAFCLGNRNMGAATRLEIGPSKLRRRRTFEAGVEMIISAGRFDIISSPGD